MSSLQQGQTWGQWTRHDSQIFRITQLMTFRVAAEPELDPYFSVLLFNNIVLSFIIDQAWGSPPFAHSILTVVTNKLIEFLGRSAVKANTKLKTGFTCRIGNILHGGSRRNFDSVAPFE